MKLSRVLICGSNYGTAYAAAVDRASSRYSVAGVLARGSDRSRALAARLGVPLLRQAEELSPDVKLACAAVGMEAHPVVLRLLEKGVSVLCEHPLPPALVRTSLKAAEDAGSRFHVNGHWSDLPAARRFIAHARRHQQRGAPAQIRVDVTDRALYGVMDLLARTLAECEPVVLETSGRDGPFVYLRGRLAACPVNLRVECSPRPEGKLDDGSPVYLNCYRVTVEFADGSLSLLAPGGPVIWNANENRVRASGESLWEAVHDEPVTADLLAGQRIDQNLQALDALAGDLAGGPTPSEQEASFLLQVSAAWESVGALIAGSLRNPSRR